MLSTHQASKFISIWLTRNGFTGVFTGSTQTLLTENRRESRPKANAFRYGKIPYYRFDNGKVGYEIADLKILCTDRIAKLCKRLLAIETAKSTGQWDYTASELNRLIDELV
jgi:hypothetical protein